ncbi:MAG TPA: alpha/beta hydrolase [Ktedonobacteraceae bacterium]|nr:alpha/beta hydrolase [Ktedonobacteraceae bacterium]
MTKQQLSNGVTLNVTDAGSGIPVVFVHGVMMSGRFFDKQVPYFSEHHRIIVPDLRGHGQSEKVLSGHTVANYARDLKDLFGALHVERPVLVGWSMGSMVVYEYLKQFGQDDVAGIVIVDQPPSDFAWEGYEFGVLTVQALGEMVEALQMDQHAVAEEFASLMLHNETPETKAWMVEEITRVPPAVASTILVNQTFQDYRPFFADVHIPTLVLFGRDNKLTPPEAGEYIASQISGAKLQIFENSSHVPFIEEADAFNQAVEAFVKDVS